MAKDISVEKALENYDDWKLMSQADVDEQDEARDSRAEMKERLAEDRYDRERDERRP
jgi:hypothetical protein